MDKQHHELHGQACAILKGARNICLFEGVGLGKQVHDEHIRDWAPDAGFDIKHDDCTGWDVEESLHHGQGLLHDAMIGNTALQSVLDHGGVGTQQAKVQAHALDFATGHVFRHAEIRNESLKAALRLQCRYMQPDSGFDCIFVFGGSAHTGDHEVHQLCSQLGCKWAAIYFKTLLNATMKATTDFYVNGKMK